MTSCIAGLFNHHCFLGLYCINSLLIKCTYQLRKAHKCLFLNCTGNVRVGQKWPRPLLAQVGPLLDAIASLDGRYESQWVSLCQKWSNLDQNCPTWTKSPLLVHSNISSTVKILLFPFSLCAYLMYQTYKTNERLHKTKT